MLEQHVPDAAERAWIEPAMLSLLGLDAGVGSQQLFGAWRTFFERLAGSGPVVMVFEDLHFADAGLLDFIDQILEWDRAGFEVREGTDATSLKFVHPEFLPHQYDWMAEINQYGGEWATIREKLGPARTVLKRGPNHEPDGMGGPGKKPGDRPERTWGRMGEGYLGGGTTQRQGDQPADRVTDDDARAGKSDGELTAEEESGADCTTERDHAHLLGAEFASET